MSVDRAVNRVWHNIAAKFRSRRRRRFLTLFPPERASTIIDLGGLVDHWDGDPRPITVLNLMDQPSSHCKVIVGDGRNTGLPDHSFDLAYSNSAIEHVGGWEDQAAFAAELRRIGRQVYCQTPNRWFPVEVHYLTFFWHWYPPLLRNYFIARFFTGWGWLVRPNRQQVLDYAATVKLLSYKQMQELFPDCVIERERFLGFTKSLIAVSRRAREAAEVSAQPVLSRDRQ